MAKRFAKYYICFRKNIFMTPPLCGNLTSGNFSLLEDSQKQNGASEHIKNNCWKTLALTHVFYHHRRLCSLSFRACLLFIYLGIFNIFGSICVVSLPLQIINNDLERGWKVDRGDKLIAEGRPTSKEKDLEVKQCWYYVLYNTVQSLWSS